MIVLLGVAVVITRRVLSVSASTDHLRELDAGLPHVVAGDFSSDHSLATVAVLALDS